MANPIQEYKKKNHVTWQLIADQTGLSIQLIYKLRTAQLSEFLGLRLATVLKIRRALNIDLLQYVDDNIINRNRH